MSNKDAFDLWLRAEKPLDSMLMIGGDSLEDGLGSGLISVFKNDAGRKTTAAM
jgi:hypothetical protein